MHTASQALAIERQASAQPSLAERVSRPKTRAILGLMRLNFLSVRAILGLMRLNFLSVRAILGLMRLNFLSVRAILGLMRLNFISVNKSNKERTMRRVIRREP
ncbi:hypothetical protein CF596_10815 [Acinetobacter sp. YT-02]|nr:hypothetical protein CF596_10815 [Acinetobacter sp. YT-02]